MKLFINILLTILLLLNTGVIKAQSLERSGQKSLGGIEVYFRFDKYDLDLKYMGNKASLRNFANKTDSIGTAHIDSIAIISQSSPEGVYEHNIRLSKKRAEAMRKYIEDHHPELKSKLFVNPDGESWEQLREYVKNDTLMKRKTIEKVLSIIDADVNIGTKKWRMAQLPIYRYLLQTYYPRIRNSVICIIYYNEPPIQSPQDTTETKKEAVAETEPEVMTPRFPYIPIPSARFDTITPFALKTNMLYDLATAIKFEIEIPVGNKWSIMAEDVFPWWHGGNKWAFQMWEMGIEGRYWFKRTDADRILTGHFLGLYLMSAKYDFQWKRSINYQGEYWSGGITYGYTLPISKLFNLEFSASFGYLSTAYTHYTPSEGYGELVKDPYKQGRIGYFGPTKLKASLVMPISLPIRGREEVRYE